MPGEGLGHFLGAMRIDGFRPASDFKTEMDRWIRRFHAATPADAGQPVLVPGDPERLSEQERLHSGIPLVDAVVADLQALAAKSKVKL
jgi:LDH2 family malate/lactate/ureidoglycolate dehydrogenase